MEPRTCIVIGGGPAGLGAAIELLEHGISPVILERGLKVGGISRTEYYQGFRFDIGGHRFFTQVPEIQKLWMGLLGDDFVKTPRLSRIYYDGQFFRYPLEPVDTLRKLGLRETMSSGLSFLRARTARDQSVFTLEEWLVGAFGQRLYESFFKDYTEKVWGRPCSQVQADWAAQRIKGMSFVSVVSHAFLRNSGVKSLIGSFWYPRLGPGMMWQKARKYIEARDGVVHLGTEVVSVQHRSGGVVGVVVRQSGRDRTLTADDYISSMALSDLIRQLSPAPPQTVTEAADRLVYRAFIMVGLIVDGQDLFPDNWIYVHSPEVQVGRVQNFGNWSPDLVLDPQKTSLGMEYFCDEGDELWNLPDDSLIALASRELESLGLARSSQVEAGVVYRESKAYPVYTLGFQHDVAIARGFLATLGNLQTIGRNGMHRYNNMDHSMLTGMLAARNMAGASCDLWNVNIDQAYHEGASRE